MQFYQQTTPYTSGASSLLMVLNHFNQKFKLIRRNEFDIWHRSAVLPTKSSSIYALAKIATQNKIKTKVVVGNPNYKFPNYRFKGYKLEEVKQAEYTSKIYRGAAIKAGVEIQEDDFSLADAKEQIKTGKLVMLRLDVGDISEQEHEVKYVLISAINKKKWEIHDPSNGILNIDEIEIKKAFDDVLLKRKRDHRMIVFG